jgi:hypothetical protein
MDNLNYVKVVIRVISSRSLRWTQHAACLGKERNGYRILIRNPEGKRPLGRHRHRWEDNIKGILKKIVCEGVDWIYQA